MNVRNESGQSLLMMLVGNGLEDEAELVLKRGAAIAALDKYNEGALFYLSKLKNGFARLFSLFELYEVDLDQRNLLGVG